jgi:hypothetical protein
MSAPSTVNACINRMILSPPPNSEIFQEANSLLQVLKTKQVFLEQLAKLSGIKNRLSPWFDALNIRITVYKPTRNPYATRLDQPTKLIQPQPTADLPSVELLHRYSSRLRSTIFEKRHIHNINITTSYIQKIKPELFLFARNNFDRTIIKYLFYIYSSNLILIASASSELVNDVDMLIENNYYDLIFFVASLCGSKDSQFLSNTLLSTMQPQFLKAIRPETETDNSDNMSDLLQFTLPFLAEKLFIFLKENGYDHLGREEAAKGRWR